MPSELHEGDCCSGCMGEIQDGYAVDYCCCYRYLTPLEQWGNPVKYPPVNGSLPPEFQYFGDKTRERYYKRFKDHLGLHVIIDTYTRTDKILRTATDTKTKDYYVWNVQ